MADISSIYGDVYNYYHSYSKPKSDSRYDAHKKSDLKDIYRSIVGLSKEESVYLVSPSSSMTQYTIAMKESAMQFGRDLSSMGGTNGDGLFEQRSVFSSDPDSVSVSYLPGASIDENPEPVSLTIDSLAKPQINQGLFLPSEQLDINPGSYSFDVSTSGSNYELQFNIGETDTNHSIQSRLARLINNAGIGMSASVSTDGDGTSALVISSITTGPGPDGEQPFELSDEDTSQQKGILDYLGIRNPLQKASWAHYTVDGEEKSSPVNTIQVNGKYSVELKKENEIGSDPIIISAKADYESLKDHIIGVAGSYNQFIRNASEFISSQPRTSLLIDNMKRMNSYYSSTMDKLGIRHNDDGTLNVDEDSLLDALKSSTTDDDISSLKNFTKSAYRKISHVQLNPMDYVDKRLVAYKNPNKTHYANPYMTSAYSGMLFNSYM